MKSTAASVSSAIRSAHEVKALPKLIAEWNLNRYVGVTASNIPSESTDGFDIENFPIESIVEPMRPIKGTSKGLVQHSLLADSYQTPARPRFHVGSVDSKYKYWIAPSKSNSAGQIGNVNPQIIYSKNIAINKVSVTVENSWASPTVYQIQITSNGGASWVNIGSPPVQNNGKLELWWTGSAWSASQPADLSSTTVINGVRFVVTQLGSGRRIDGSLTTYKSPATGSFGTTNGHDTWFSLIEISARLVVDLTSRVIAVSDQMDAGEPNHITPMGTITSNTATVKLWNGDGVFNPKNTSSPYYGYIEPNVEFNLSYIYDISGAKTSVQQFRMFTEEWNESGDSTTSVSLSDGSKFLKETKPAATKYENQTLSQIIYRLCDQVGFTDYNIFDNPATVDYKIPVWWTDGEQTLWEIFDELSQATQSLVFFDAWGKLNVKTREDGYNRASAPVWTLRGTKAGSELPDIISVQQTDQYEANVVKVIYKSTKWADEVNGFPEFTTVWTPEETTVLRSSVLLRQLNPGDGSFLIPPHEAAHWPYSGLVQIQGETIAYDGKRFVYRNGHGGWSGRVINDQDEFDKFSAEVPHSQRFMNHFDGQIIIAERGVWNTDVETHRVEANGYDVRRFGPNDFVSSNAGFHHLRQFSTVQLSHGGRLNGPQDFMVAARGHQNDTGWRHLGTRLRFNSGNNVDQRAGLVFNVVGHRGGYYVELTPTSHLSTKERQNRKEIGFYTITGVQPNTKIPERGAEATILEDRWHNVDVYFGWDNQLVRVYVDGKMYINIQVPGGQQFAPNGKFGMFIRGRSECEFEYLYAIARQREPMPMDDYSSLYRIDGWHDGLKMVKEWKFKPVKKKKSGKPAHKKNQQFMDEFGPYVHEIREFDVKFDPAPVQHSKIYSTNDWAALLVDYRADAFGARFTMANSERRHAVVHGEDTLTFPGSDGAAINQQLLVYGRALVVGEDEEVVVRNEQQVRARGEITTELTSQWIQTKAAAEALGKWITSHWGTTTDQLEIEVFGNPLFEIGDLVSIEHPTLSMNASTHQYFVTGISTQFDQGISTTLTLHRKN